MSRVRAFALACLLGLLAGCGPLAVPPTPTPVQTPAVPPVPTSEPTPTAALRAQADGTVTLRLWIPEELSLYSQAPGAEVLTSQLADFASTYSDLRVEVTVKKAHGRGGLLDFLRTARDAAPSVLPDLIVLDAAELEMATAARLIQPLDALLSPSQANDRFPFAVQMGQVNTYTMGFLIGAQVQHAAYRVDAFVAPSLAWTDVLSAPGEFLFAAGGIDRKVNEATLMQYLAAGGTLVDVEGRPALSREAVLSVFTFYSSCISSGVISPSVILGLKDADQVWERFFSERQGVVAVVPSDRYWLEADETLRASSIPTRDGQPFAMVSHGWALAMVTADPSRQALAMVLFDWLIAPDHSAQWTQEAGYLPGTRSALKLWDVSAEERALLMDLLDATVPPVRPDLWATSGQVLQEALEALLRGRATPQQAANLAVEVAGP